MPENANQAFNEFSFYDLPVINSDKTKKRIPEMKQTFNKLCDYVSVLHL